MTPLAAWALAQVAAGSNASSDEAKAEAIRWRFEGHEYLGRAVTMRAADLPTQGLTAASEGAVGTIIKWAPAEEAGDTVYFRAQFPGKKPWEELGMGVDLEEHEMLVALKAHNTRGGAERRSTKRYIAQVEV